MNASPTVAIPASRSLFLSERTALLPQEPEFAGKFRLLVFAIMERPRKPHGLDGKFADFYRKFGSFDMT